MAQGTGQSVARRRWPDRVRLPLAFDPVRLRADLARLEQATWTPHFVPEHYHGLWSALPFRAPAGARHPIQQIAPLPDLSEWTDTDWLRPCEYIQRVRDAFECPIRSMRLMSLTPGSTIKPHRDLDLAAEEGHARIHVPITTNACVDFRLNGERVEMAPGSAWYLRLSDPHSVINRGTTTRVHLVLDAMMNPWLEAQLDQDRGGPDAGAPFGMIEADRS